MAPTTVILWRSSGIGCNGKTIENPKAAILEESSQTDSITDEYCKMLGSQAGPAWSRTKMYEMQSIHVDSFEASGGLKSMGESLGRGMVLALSVWDDPVNRMLWLDAEKSLSDQDPNDPGISHGPCEFWSGDPEQVQRDNPAAYVTYSNIKVGPLGSTFW